MQKTLTTAEIRARLATAYYSLDVYTEVEKHTSTRLHIARNGKQGNGACPYDDCSADENGFMVWRELTDRECHFYCRTCRRGGDIVKLVRDINGWSFSQACQALGIPNPYQDNEIFNQAPIRREAKARQDTPSPDWQILEHLYPRMCLALQKHPRALAYLAERAIPLDIAIEYGLGYIPPLTDATHTPELEKVKKWCDRVIFTLETPDGRRGFIGRALALWQPGMDENKHKEVLNAAKINRYEKTYPAGYFNWQAMKGEHVYVVEGLFDALAIIAGGIPGVIALAGTSLRIQDIPKHIEMVDICLDADASGKSTARQLYKVLYRAGYEVRSCTPDRGKDWSEAYRLHGVDGLAHLLAVRETEPQPTEIEPEALDLAALPDTCQDCGANINSDRDFFYQGELNGVIGCYCVICRDPVTGQTRASRQDRTPEQVMTVTDSYGRWRERHLRGFDAVTPPLFAELAARPRVYPAPFAAYGLVAGKLTQIGMHGCEPGEYWSMEEWAAREQIGADGF